MTPPAATAAARMAAAPRSAQGTAPKARTSAPRQQRRGQLAISPARRPRRVSGPASAAPGADRVAPALESAASAVRERPVTGEASFGLLGRSRVWIAVLVVGLASVVFLEGQLRGLNSSVGGSVQQITSLERDNAVLRSEISGLSSDMRIVEQARRMGFVEPPIGSSRFLAASGHDSGRAVALMAPSGTGSSYASLDSGSADAVTGSGDGIDGGSTSVAETPTGQGAETSQLGSGTAEDGATITTAAVPDGGAGPTGG